MISFNASMHRRFIKIVLVAKGKDGRDCLHKDCMCESTRSSWTLTRVVVCFLKENILYLLWLI